MKSTRIEADGPQQLVISSGVKVMQSPEQTGDAPIGCCPLFRRNTLTLLAAKGKVGKTSFMCQVIDNDLHNDVGWWIVSEEAPARWRVRWNRYKGLPLVPIMFRQENLMPWETLCLQINHAIKSDDEEAYPPAPAGLWIDTFTSFARLGKDADNAAEQIEYRLRDLVPLVGMGLAVALGHHLRKGKADDIFDTIRGSEHYKSGCDLVAVMTGKVGSPSPRTIHVTGREFDPPLPEKLTVTRDPDTGFITWTEGGAQVAEEGTTPSGGIKWVDWAAEAVGVVGPLATLEEVMQAWPGGKIGDTKLRGILTNAAKMKMIVQHGVGRRGHPRRYSLADSPSKKTGASELNATPTDSNNDSSAPSSLEGRDCERIDDLALFSPPLRLAGGGAA